MLGIEILGVRVAKANERLAETPHKGVSFAKCLTPDHVGYEVAISLNSFEHFSDPDAILRQIFGALRPGGKFYMSFGPPWYSAYGPHQLEFTKMRWPHLLFSERTYMKAREHFKGAVIRKTYSDWLNQMTVVRYEETVRRSGFSVFNQEYLCTRGMGVLKHIRGLREIAINRIACVLQKP